MSLSFSNYLTGYELGIGENPEAFYPSSLVSFSLANKASYSALLLVALDKK